MYTYTIIKERSLDRVLSYGFKPTWMSESLGRVMKPVWLTEQQTVPIATYQDCEVFVMLFEDQEPLAAEDIGLAFAFENAVSLKMRLRYPDQVRATCPEDFDQLEWSEPLWKGWKARRSASRNFLISNAGITPNQIVSASIFNPQKGSWSKIPTGKRLIRHRDQYHSSTRGIDLHAA